MGKGIVSIFVVFGILYGLHITEPSNFKPDRPSPADKFAKLEPTKIAKKNPESPKARMMSPKKSEKPEEKFAQEWVNPEGDKKLAKAPLTQVETPEAKLVPPKQEAKPIEIKKEAKPKVAEPKKLSGELVLNNSTKEETATEEGSARPGFDALPSEINGGNANIYFAFDSYELSKSGDRALTKLAAKLISDPSLSVQIAGHTDSVGDPEVNKAFSSARAQAVLNKLSSLGVPRDRTKIVSYGKSKPSESNASAKGRSANRRVEVQIIQK